MFDLGDKSATRSMTIIAAAVFAVIQSLESMGVIPPGAMEAIATCGKSVAVLLGVFGLRRAINSNGLGAVMDELDSFIDGDYELTDEELEEFEAAEELEEFELFNQAGEEISGDEEVPGSSAGEEESPAS